MRIILTNHARLRAKERDISFLEIVDAMLNPDVVDEQGNNISCFKKKKEEKLLLVYTKDEEWNRIVVTVIKTSKIDKYL